MAADNHRLVMDNLRLATRMSKAFRAPVWVDRSDLYQYGIEGLYKAASSWDSTAGTPFYTYAWARVRGSVLDELRREYRRTRREVSVPMDDMPIPSVQCDTEDRMLAEDVLALLPVSFRDVMTRIFLNDEPQMAVAESLGVSKARISQIKSQSIRLLRELLNNT